MDVTGEAGQGHMRPSPRHQEPGELWSLWLMDLRASARPVVHACVLCRADELLPPSAPRWFLGLGARSCVQQLGVNTEEGAGGSGSQGAAGELSWQRCRQLTWPLTSEQHNRFVLDCKDKEPDVLFVGDSMVQLLQQYEVPLRREPGAAGLACWFSSG